MTRAVAAVALGVLAIAGCGGDEPGRIEAPTDGQALAAHTGKVGVRPGPGERERTPVRNPYAGDPRALAEGERFYVAYNCNACHGTRGGGAMGPPLRDDVWIYGGDPASIYQSIMEGRPYGMPTWRGMLPEDQAWKIVAYVESLGTGIHGPPAMMPPADRAPWLEGGGSGPDREGP